MMFDSFFKQNKEDGALGARIRNATSFGMSETDRRTTREYLQAYVAHRPVAASRFMPARRKRRFLLPFIATTLIISLTTGTAAAAESTIPGDTLYPIKVSVTEPLRDVLAFSPEAKADWAIERAERRIAEINQLVAQDSVDETILADADARLDTQVRTAEERSAAANEKDDDPNVERRLVAVLRAHEALLGEASVGIGGSFVDATFEEMQAAEESAALATSDAESDVSVSTFGIERATQMVSDINKMATTTPALAAPVEPPAPVKKEKAAARTKTQKGSGVTENAVKRQKKAAEERVEALERLIERMEKRGQKSALLDAKADLAAAQAELEIGESSFENDAWADASAHFNIALRSAIDTRESLLDQTEKERESNNRRNNDRDDADRKDSDEQNRKED